MSKLEKNLSQQFPALKDKLLNLVEHTQSILSLSDAITKTVVMTNKKLVLLVDEVDASSNYLSFLKFLSMLRSKFLDRFSPLHYTFHSVVLAGVHDVKSLKFKIRDQEAAQYNSPWNIAVQFEVEMEFNPAEIAPMLVEYSQAENVQIDVPAIAEKLFYFTAGYPFLVSRLCQIIAKKSLPKKSEKTWTAEDVENAVQIILSEANTNFESLIKNLQNNPDLYDLVYALLMEGQTISYNPYNDTIHKGVLYGVFKQNGMVKIHNRIYEQMIYKFMATNLEEKQIITNNATENQFLLANQSLDFEQILRRFQAFIQEQYSQKDQAFLEREWRLIFLAFLKPIINGKGFDFKEAQISEERRLDVVVVYGTNKYIVELKRWYGQEAHQRGLLQLHDYLTKQNVDIGFLVIFDHRREQSWRDEWIELENKRIFAIWI
ncbi:MAG: AAA family ATPase [Microscillaceae bacterium]|nr:AAA family ATPase [Microscillaceae bacterium]